MAMQSIEIVAERITVTFVRSPVLDSSPWSESFIIIPVKFYFNITLTAPAVKKERPVRAV